MSTLLRSFARDFDELVATGGERVAFIDARYEARYAYSELDRLMRRCRALFAARGARPGDCVLSLLPTSADGIVAFLAAAQGGFSFAPLPAEAVAHEVARALDLVRPRVCLVPEIASEAVLDAIRSAEVPVVRVSLDGAFAWLPELGDESPPANAPAGRLYLTTSGSTGEPKAIVLDIDRLWSSGKAFAARHRFLGRDSRFLNILPISYLGGLFNLCLVPMASGGDFVVGEPFSGRSLLSFWQQVEQFDVTVLWLVPTIVRGLLAIADRTSRQRVSPPKRVRACFLGTAPIDLATKARFEETFGIPLLENFALSETTFLTSELLDDGMPREEGSVGTALPYATLRFLPLEDAGDGDGSAAGTAEIAVRTPFLFLGYLQRDGSLDLPLDDEGYFHTGDVGHLTADGVVVVGGRLRDVIKKGGYFIALREIELLAERHPAVREAAAVPIAHEFYGESFRLLLIPEPGADQRETAAALGAWLRERLVRYKWPDKIEAVSEFPRTASGKIRKKLLVGEPSR
jgi:acyl-CoA synthetase (AMP-forming)/AMP-acid ligase II